MSDTAKEQGSQSTRIPFKDEWPRTPAIDLAKAIYAQKNELNMRRVNGDRITRMDEIAAYVEIIEAARERKK